MDNRILLWDIAKGILIILVIIGHLPIDSAYTRLIYSFHMPCFFIIGGVLFRFAISFRIFFIKKVKSYLVPYFSWLIVYTIVCYMCGDTQLNILSFVVGGRSLVMPYNVFWFITSYLGSILIFRGILGFTTIWKKIIAIIVCYLLAEAESYFFDLSSVDTPILLRFFPLNLDVSLMGVVYIAIGYYSYCLIGDRILVKGNFINLFYTLTGVAVFVFFYISGYQFDMKYARYYFLLDLLMPVICLYVLLQVGRLIMNCDFLTILFSKIGACSLSVMYLHMLFIYKSPTHTGILVICSICAIVFALFFDAIANRSFVLSYIFLGKTKLK